MEDIKKIEKTHEKQDSIAVNRNQKGAISLKIKRYYDYGSERIEDVVREMKETEELLLETFSDKNE